MIFFQKGGNQMKKSFLVVLLVIFALTLWTVVAFGKSKKDEPAKQPTQIQKTEKNVEPQFPGKVTAPASNAYYLPVGTTEDFQRGVTERKGVTPEQVNQRNGLQQPAELGAAKELLPARCQVSNVEGDLYYTPAGSNYLNCWGAIRAATLLDLDYNSSAGPSCVFPYYAFRVDTVGTIIYSPNDPLCSLQVVAEVYTSAFSANPARAGLRVPSTMVGTSDTVWVRHDGGFQTINLPIKDLSGNPGACVNGPFFAVIAILNTDEFKNTALFGGGNCYTGGHNWLPISWIFDTSGRIYQSFFSSSYLTPGWYEMVLNSISSGAIYNYAIGRTQPENACTPPANEWFYNWSFAADSACGMPDFDQGQIPPAFCGPTAGADALYWFGAKGDIALPRECSCSDSRDSRLCWNRSRSWD